MNRTTYFETTLRLNLGHSAYRLGKYEEAIKEYQKAVESDDEFASLFLAFAERDAGKFNESNASFLKGFQRHHNIFNTDKIDESFLSPKEGKQFDLDKILNAINTPFAYYIMGYVSNRIGRYDDAIKFLENSLKLENKLSNTHIELGSALFGKNHKDETAIQHFQEALRIDEKNYDAYIELAYLFSLFNKPGDVLDLFEKGEILHSSSSKLYLYWGHALVKLNRAEEALMRYQRALEIDSNNYVAYYSTGLVYENQDRKEEAYMEYERALAKNPFYWEAYLNCANISYSAGIWTDAVNCYEKASNLNSKLNVGLDQWGNALMKLGRHDEGIEKLKKSSEVQPNSMTMTSLGEALFQTNKIKEAINYYNRAIEIDPNAYQAYDKRAEAFLKAEMKQEAESDFGKSRSLRFKEGEIYGGKNVGEIGSYDEARMFKAPAEFM